MKKLLRKIFVFMISLLPILSFSFAQSDEYSISIDVPDSFKAGEAVDLTVVILKNGEKFKDYSGMIYMYVVDSNNKILDDKDDCVIPSDSIYNFKATDQGERKFEKGFQIKKAGTYKLIVEDRSNGYENQTSREKTIIVTGGSGTSDVEIIEISYPVDSSTESKDSFSVIGSCSALKNSPVSIYINEKIAGSGMTDGQGKFTVFVSGLLSGDNTLQAKISDINNTLLGQSATIKVKYQTATDDVFKSLEILPKKTLKQGDKIIFNVATSDEVTTAQIEFSNGQKYTLDRISQGSFSKEITALSSGNLDVSVILNEGINEYEYEKVDSIYVEENIAITNIKFANTGVDGKSVIISWNTIGDVSKYKINYGTGKTDLKESITVTTQSVLVDNLQIDTTYYFQIVPMDSGSHNSGDPSEIIEYRSASLPCVVKGIKIRTEHIGDNYYLVWDPVENVSSYEVYKSDWKDMTDSRLVGSLTGTRFQYLFDPDAEKDEYAYYQVQALCKDGTTVIIDEAQKVKVGPMENILLIIVISIFAYSMYRVYSFSDKQ